MKRFRSISTYFATTAVIAISGCATNNPPLQVALNDLTSDSRENSGDYLYNKSLMSISGMIPVSSPGTIVHFVNPRDATSAIGINPKGKTCLLTSTVCVDRTKEARLQAACEIRQLFRDYQYAQLAIVNKINIFAAQSFATISSGRFYRDPANVANATNHLMQEYAAEIAQLKVDVFESESALIAAVHKNEFIATRWTRHSDSSRSGNVAGLGSYTRRSQSDAEGFWLLDGLRLQFLVVGTDVAERIPNIRPAFENGTMQSLEAISVTSFVAQTRLSCWLSVSDELRSAQATATLRIQDALHLAAGSLEAVSLLMNLQADLDASELTRTNLSNIGTVANITWVPETYEWDPAECLTAAKSQGWITFWTQSASLAPRTVSLLQQYFANKGSETVNSSANAATNATNSSH